MGMRALIERFQIKSIGDDDLAALEASASASKSDDENRSVSTDLSSVADTREFYRDNSELAMLRRRIETERAERREEQAKHRSQVQF